MKNRWNILAAALLITVASACNSDTEKRITNLERRVNALENKGITRSSATPSSVATRTSNTAETRSVESPVSANASFKWENNSVYNFGTIKEGDIIEHTFRFTNNGTEDLLIKSTSASCGCTVPEHTKTPVPPGGKGEIKVKYNSKGKSGQQSPVITIVANTKPAQTRLSLRGVVEKKDI